ncbi:endonuclease/exonuclease/phosphatase family protein [Aeoliella sp. SH292]|uniref:endonuclease/exonuclease/phosphatase family protein n=1 Tax=Aeoliella sp. SH292 TaxID=3454464 RepID=UPI003F9E681C
MRSAFYFLILGLSCTIASEAAAVELKKPPGSIRVATYNVSMYRDREGQLAEDLEKGDNQARSIAEVLRRVQPDVLLLNEFDFDQTGQPGKRFLRDYLGRGDNGLDQLLLGSAFYRPVNTGVPSGLDLDNDGIPTGPADAFGFGRYPGQYGMRLITKFPIDLDSARTFQKFLWKDMPGAKLPVDPKTGESYYSPEVLDIFRLSSKSHWDVPVEVTIGDTTRTIHLLCAHPTPPVFDGPEDRNGRRNHDEIRLWADYITPDKSDYLVDDRGNRGGLAEGESFVILGDLNADPVDGDSGGDNIGQLLKHPRVNATFTPASDGAVDASAKHADLNSNHQGDAKFDTANFSGDGHGNLRVDYVLPSRDLTVVGSGVYWPKEGEPGSEAILATDHRLVWVDLAFPTEDSQAGDGKTE